MSSRASVISLLVPAALGSAFVGSMQVPSSTGWGFQYLQNRPEDTAQNVICSV